MKSKEIFVGLDLGTSEIRCVVGHLGGNEGEPALSVVGIGSCPTRGLRKGVIVHPDEVTQAVASAIEEAERVTGHSIKAVTVNINGSHVESQTSRGVVAISNHDHLITNDDRLRAEDAATIMQMPPNREIIQLFAKDYIIDGQGGVKDPIGMQGVRLEVDALIMTASTPILRTIDDMLASLNVSINHHTTSALGAAEAVLNRTSRESGSAVIDIGSGTTNIAVMDEGEVEHVAVIPVGGMHVTNDLAIGLRTELTTAEKIKREYVNLKTKQRGSKQLQVDEETLSFSLEDVDMIVRARLDELSELIDKQLKKAGYSKKLPGGVVVTGAGSELVGIEEHLRDTLELPVKRGKVLEMSGLIDAVDRPGYQTAAGLMALDMLLSGVNDSHVKGSQLNGLGFKLRSLIKKKK